MIFEQGFQALVNVCLLWPVQVRGDPEAKISKKIFRAVKFRFCGEITFPEKIGGSFYGFHLFCRIPEKTAAIHLEYFMTEGTVSIPDCGSAWRVTVQPS